MNDSAPTPTPAPATTDTPDSATHEPEVLSYRQEPRRPLIVLLDDNDEIRKILARMLEREGYDVVTSASAAEVLMMLEVLPASLLISDVVMSGMSGVSLTRQVRASPGLGWLPVLVFSASDAEDEAIDAGADAFLSKESMDWPVLRAAVVGLIGAGVPRTEGESAPRSMPARAAG